MNKGPRKIPKERMIHIRLDDATHKFLKIHAAQTGTTIQQLVESLIRIRFQNTKAGNMQP